MNKQIFKKLFFNILLALPFILAGWDWGLGFFVG